MTYSAAEVTVVVNHPDLGQKVINGTGFTKVNISYTDDKTKREVGADGKVMVSKIKSKQGDVTISILQASEAHKWLTNWVNYCASANASKWDRTSIEIHANFTNGLITSASQVSPMKIPDENYGASGETIDWQLSCGELDRS